MHAHVDTHSYQKFSVNVVLVIYFFSFFFFFFIWNNLTLYSGGLSESSKTFAFIAYSL